VTKERRRLDRSDVAGRNEVPAAVLLDRGAASVVNLDTGRDIKSGALKPKVEAARPSEE
jgi:hypothetical protein